MPKFRFDNCTSKQFVREKGWIPEAKQRIKRLAATATKKADARRLRYLTFCAEGALDVIALRNAKIIKKSGKDLYDSVVFFDFAPQSVDKTLNIIEGATGFPTDFFKLVNLDYDFIPDDQDLAEMPDDEEENDATFQKRKDMALFVAFRKAFPFDLINLDVERYVFVPSEELPGKLLKAWDKVLEWQKRSRPIAKTTYTIDQFTLFFTTKIGPRELPDGHKMGLIGALNDNLDRFPSLETLLKQRFEAANPQELYAKSFDEFLKLAVPKALVTRAVAQDWILDKELSYRAFEFRRKPPVDEHYTMIHYVLHFERCNPPVTSQIVPGALPDPVKVQYKSAVEQIFSTVCEDVDSLKLATEEKLRDSLRKMGITEFVTD